THTHLWTINRLGRALWFEGPTNPNLEVARYYLNHAPSQAIGMATTLLLPLLLSLLHAGLHGESVCACLCVSECVCVCVCVRACPTSSSFSLTGEGAPSP